MQSTLRCAKPLIPGVHSEAPFLPVAWPVCDREQVHTAAGTHGVRAELPPRTGGPRARREQSASLHSGDWELVRTCTCPRFGLTIVFSGVKSGTRRPCITHWQGPLHISLPHSGELASETTILCNIVPIGTADAFKTLNPQHFQDVTHF